MDENKIIIDITPYLEDDLKQESPSVKTVAFHSNPILKKQMLYSCNRKKDRFSLKDLFW